jgi:diacylglycerol kinase (ATP)
MSSSPDAPATSGGRTPAGPTPNRATGHPALQPGDRLTIVVNPVAWRTRDSAWRSLAEATLGPRFHLDWQTPRDAAAVGEIVAAARSAGSRAVIVAGGDGSVSRAIEALAGTPTPLGLLPLGTGNDLARELGWPADVKAAIPRVLDARERVLDLVEVNGRPFATVGLIGLTADGALRVGRWQIADGWRRRLGRVLGRQAYRVSGALSLVQPRTLWRTCTIAIDAPQPARFVDEPVYGLFVTNGRRLGSGLVLPVDSDPGDGRFEVCLVRRVNRLRLMIAFACLTQHWPLPRGVLVALPATRATVEWPQQTMFSADGEALLSDRRFELKIRPAALRVLA